MEQIMKRKNRAFKTLVVALTFIIVFTLSGCDGGLDYSDFKKDHLDTWEDVLNQDQKQYLVYFYGPRCSYCITIKDDVLEFALDNEADIKVFFISSEEVFDLEEFPVSHPTTGVQVQGTPTMLVVNQGVLRDVNVGADKIQSLLEKINEGSYALID